MTDDVNFSGITLRRKRRRTRLRKRRRPRQNRRKKLKLFPLTLMKMKMRRSSRTTRKMNPRRRVKGNTRRKKANF